MTKIAVYSKLYTTGSNILLFYVNDDYTILDLYDKYCINYNENDLIFFYDINNNLIRFNEWHLQLKDLVTSTNSIFIKNNDNKNVKIYDNYNKDVLKVRQYMLNNFIN